MLLKIRIIKKILAGKEQFLVKHSQMVFQILVLNIITEKRSTLMHGKRIERFMLMGLTAM